MRKLKFDKDGDIARDQKIRYEGAIYDFGNRGHGLVELYRNGKFVLCIEATEAKYCAERVEK